MSLTLISTAEQCTPSRTEKTPLLKKIFAVGTVLAMTSSQSVFGLSSQVFESNLPSYRIVNIADQTAYNHSNVSIHLRWENDMENDILMWSALSQSLLRIDEIAQLQDNWNENGASSFSSELLSCIRNLVHHLPVQPEIFPTARDSIQLEYENEVGDYLEFELFETGRIKAFSFLHSGKTETKDIALNQVNEVVSEFYGCSI